MFSEISKFIRETYKNKNEYIPLHEPRFLGNEKKYLNECIDSTFVSSVGEFVNKVEKDIAHRVGSKFAVATINGTSALHTSLMLVGVKSGHEVITQSLTFVATCNAISYCNASPVFVDVDKSSLGMSPNALEEFLTKNATIKSGLCININSGKIIKACVPMHTFGHACDIDRIKQICDAWNIIVVEDAAESLGTFYKGKHTGTFGKVGIFSFNGNKTITAGNGGCIITDDETLANEARHITTTAKAQSATGEFYHSRVGYNYRLSNVNAAILLAQLENLDMYVSKKRLLAKKYEEFFKNLSCEFFTEPISSRSNYWLNCLVLENRKQSRDFLKHLSEQKIGARPVWVPMHKLPMYKNCLRGDLPNTEWLADRLVNIPSSVRL